MEQVCSDRPPKTACNWIKTATAIFRELARTTSNYRMKFYNGNGTATIYYAGNADVVLIFNGSSQNDADKIVSAIKQLERCDALTIENFESVEPPTFLLHAKLHI